MYICQKNNLLFCFSVVLMENGDVYTFGYGQHGQLGHGDVNSRWAGNWRMWLCIAALLHRKWLNFCFSVDSKCEYSNIVQIKLISSCSALISHNPLDIDTVTVLLYCVSNLFNTWRLLCIVISIALIIEFEMLLSLQFSQHMWEWHCNFIKISLFL